MASAQRLAEPIYGVINQTCFAQSTVLRWRMGAPKKKEQIRASEMRQQGLAITEIAKKLGVSKGSVSVWVRDVPLTKEQRQALKEHMWAGLAAGRQKARLVNQQRQAEHMANLKRRAYEIAKVHWNEPLFIAGVMLYQGEGRRSGNTEIVNSDPRFLRLFKRWVDTYTPGHEFTLRIRLFDDNDEEESLEYWTSQVPVERVLIRRREGGKRSSGKLPHGMASLYVHASTDLNRTLRYIFTALVEHLL
jgi:transposase-like protein